MRPNQIELTFRRGLAHGRTQFGVQVRGVAKRPTRPGALGDPRRVLEQMAEQGNEPRAICAIDFRQRGHSA
jgi:hypothetical protein